MFDTLLSRNLARAVEIPGMSKSRKHGQLIDGIDLARRQLPSRSSQPTILGSETWSNMKFSNDSFKFVAESAVLDDTHFVYWQPEVFSKVFKPSVQNLSPLPTDKEAFSIVEEYFEGFNHAFPIYHRASFLKLLQEHDMNKDQRSSSGWWASLNIVLALGHRIRSMRTANALEEDPKAWKYLQNALEVLPELTLRNRDLLSVQAMLGIAVFLQGTSSPYPTHSLVATTIRQMHSLGLHQDSLDSSEDAEQRRRVFWIGYLLDKDSSLRTGQPLVQHDHDMDVRLPDPFPADNIGILIGNSGTSINIFRLRVELSIIQGQVYQDLYSIQGMKRSDAEKRNIVAKLNNELQRLKATIPQDFHPESMYLNLSAPSTLHMAILYSNFFNTLSMVHCKTPGYNLNLDRMISHTAASTPLLESEEIALSAARSILKLMRLFQHGNYASVWYIPSSMRSKWRLQANYRGRLNLYFSFAAFVTVLTNLYLRPLHGWFNDDWELVTRLERQIQLLDADGVNKGVISILGCCSKIMALARNSSTGIDEHYGLGDSENLVVQD